MQVVSPSAPIVWCTEPQPASSIHPSSPLSWVQCVRLGDFKRPSNDKEADEIWLLCKATQA